MNCTRCQTPYPEEPTLSCAACGDARPGAARPRDPLLGQTIAGRFRIEGVIGQGGMGKVYKAMHLSLGKEICLKVLKPALLDDPTLVGRFEREAQAASRLNHPNAIHVVDFGRVSDGGTLYIAMEYVQGKDLRTLLRDEGPLSETRIIHLVAQVLSALAEAHAHNVIHRDLKPENIMVEQRLDQADAVKVLDFGIAKILDSNLPGLTRSDVVCGTPQYMSPEQATGSDIDARCDLYAVGIILYQLTTGELPFDGGNSMEVLTRQVNEEPMPPRQRAPQAAISPEMERLILRAMDKEPSARPQDAGEFRRLLLELHAAPGSSLSPQELSQRPTAIHTPAVTATQPANAQSGPTALKRLPTKFRWVALFAGLLGAIGLSLFIGRRQTASPASGELSKLPKLSNSITSAAGADAAPASEARAKASTLFEQAHQLQRESDTASARDLLEQAVALDPDNARAHYSLAGLYLHTQPARARAQYDLAVKLDAATYAAQVALIESTLPPADPGEQRDR